MTPRQRLARPFLLDLRSLAAFRIGLGLILLYDLLARARDLGAHYSDAGVLPRALVPETPLGQPALSLHLLSGSATWQGFLFLLAGLLGLALLLGYRTRLATCGSWFLLGSLHLRNPLVCYAGDELLKLLLFWSLFLPLGARWSLDGRRADEATEPRDASVLSAGSVALVLQVCFVYLFATLFKSGPTWWDGTAVYYALNIDLHTSPLGRALLGSPGLCAALTWFTLAAEGLAPLLLLSPVWFLPARLLGIGLLAGLQVGLFLCMDLGIFQPVSLVALLALLPSRVWERGREDADVPVRVERRGWVNALPACCIAAALVWNVVELRHREHPEQAVPTPLRQVYGLLHLDQGWSMFAPDPADWDGWFVVAADPAQGPALDLLHGGTLAWNKPADVSGSCGGDRWKQYLVSLSEQPEAQPRRDACAEYFVAEWDRRHGGRLRTLWVVFMREETLPERTTRVVRINLARWP